MEFTIKEFKNNLQNKLYLVLDTETATLPEADNIAKTPEQKTKIAIAKPLIYDIGYILVDKKLNCFTKRNFLVSEIFSVPSIYNTAYYKDKRPIYLEKIRNNEIVIDNWNSIAKILISDLQKANCCAAFNAMFDFKKAIPFTEAYIQNLYSPSFDDWMKYQIESMKAIAKSTDKYDKPEKNFDKDHFKFREINYPMADIWGIACKSIVNTFEYKRLCLKNNLISDSGLHFKTSAETVYNYILKDYNFAESHTAIDDAMIEAFILSKALHKGKIDLGIEYFPFKLLGTTEEFLRNNPKISAKYFDVVINKMEDRLLKYEQEEFERAYNKTSSFISNLSNIVGSLKALKEERI